jgi:hypothetical protein
LKEQREKYWREKLNERRQKYCRERIEGTKIEILEGQN